MELTNTGFFFFCFVSVFFFPGTAMQVSATLQLPAPIHNHTNAGAHALAVTLVRRHRLAILFKRGRAPSPFHCCLPVSGRGLPWKQGLTGNNRRGGKERNPVLCPPLRHSSSVPLLLFKHVMHFQTNYRFSMEPGRAGDRSACPTIRGGARKPLKAGGCNTPGVLFLAQTASHPPEPPARTTTTTTTQSPHPCLPHCNNTMSAPNSRPLLWAIMATVLAERAVGGGGGGSR